MSRTITLTSKKQPYCTVELSGLSRETLEHAARNLRKETGKKFIVGEMDFDESAEFSAECVRIVTESLTMADGTRPILGKPPAAARRFFRERQNEALASAITKAAKELDDEEREELEVVSGN